MYIYIYIYMNCDRKDFYFFRTRYIKFYQLQWAINFMLGLYSWLLVFLVSISFYALPAATGGREY